MTEVGGIAADRLRSLIERIERLEEEKKALSGDIRDVFAEAKSVEDFYWQASVLQGNVV